MKSTFFKLALLTFLFGTVTGESQTTNQQLTANIALDNAIIRDDASGCAVAIGQGAQVNSVQRGDTMLITAAREGLPVTQCLVDHGADINGTVSELGHPLSPVWAAAQGKHFDVVDYLVEKGAVINRTDDEESLLMFAIAHGSLPDVKVLVEHGADVNYASKGPQGLRTALTFAIGLRHGDEIEYLDAHGAHK